ncbi:G2-specific serine/threonine protein kinase [Puccinia graminis f. sp. tritici]|uniref:G2-specific serine/threonine protein kinase n=1 Tax=Puccinia graminis f. sp. tritici TaxID=56615 RepID=A0A5B0MFC5_PUCGR|nr:G2-specific serine/threonine protein kinase [Puccinia graminis f. sp. tritici]
MADEGAFDATERLGGPGLGQPQPVPKHPGFLDNLNQFQNILDSQHEGMLSSLESLSLLDLQVDTTMMDLLNLTVGYGSLMKLDRPFKHLVPGPNKRSVLGLIAQSVSSDPKQLQQVKSSKLMASLKSTYSLLSGLKSDIQSPELLEVQQ